jgi:hypothetical protein
MIQMKGNYGKYREVLKYLLNIFFNYKIIIDRYTTLITNSERF